jgi:hypothetical protein
MSTYDFNGSAVNGYYPQIVDGIDKLFNVTAKTVSLTDCTQVDVICTQPSANFSYKTPSNWVDMFPQIPGPADPDFGKDGFCCG